MPNRILRDCCDSEPVNKLTCQSERFFYRLIMKVDDYGRQSASPKLLRPMMFPLLLEQVREADLQRWLAECEKAGLIRLYTVNGKEYLEIVNFRQRLRVKRASKCPDPSYDGQMTVTRPTDDSHATARSECECGSECADGIPPVGGLPDSVSDDPLQLPSDLNKPALSKAWADWLAYRAERKPKVTPRSANRCFADFRQWGEQASVEAIHLAIRNGWQGLFAPKSNGQPQPPKHQGSITKAIIHGKM
jgi:hypothetical protein